MFAAPVAPRCTHAALYFVEDEEDFIFIANSSKRLQPFAAEMVISALALDRLDDDGAKVDLVSGNVLANLGFGFFLSLDDIRFAFGFLERKINGRI